MTPALFVVVALAGGAGAALRYVLDLVVARLVGSRFPWGTLAINVTGSFALGTVVGLGLPPEWTAVVGTGLLGGYTTFSSVAVTTALLAEDGRTRAAVGNAVGTLVLATGAAWGGLALGVLLVG